MRHSDQFAGVFDSSRSGIIDMNYMNNTNDDNDSDQVPEVFKVSVVG